jgi:putative ABC transport system permease protein
MKFLPLIWAGLWRKPARTLLTLLSISIAFILFGLLQGVDSAFTRLIGQQKLDRMFVDSRYNQPIPINYKAQIQRLEGIKKITEIQFMPGYYQDQKTGGMLTIFTIPSIWLGIRPEFAITQAELDAVARTRDGVIVSSYLAKVNHWKIGDRYTVKGVIPRTDGSTDWTFQICGIMVYEDPEAQNRGVLANYAYMDESRGDRNQGTVSRFLMRIADANRSAQTARQIDALFANSPVATRTQSEVDQATSQLSTIGDFKFFTRAIMSAVFFALLFLTFNTTMESIRERTSELATLKTLGFSDTAVMCLVLAESATLFVVSAAIGLGIAMALFPLAKNFVGSGGLPTVVLYVGALLALGAAFVSAIVPAFRAMRLNIVRALAVR